MDNQDKMPDDFIACSTLWVHPFRYVRMGDDSWQVQRWDGGWLVYGTCNDREAVLAYARAENIFVNADKKSLNNP